MHLIIADHTLKDYQGHSFEYCKSVREIAIAKGWKVRERSVKHRCQKANSLRVFKSLDWQKRVELLCWSSG